MFSLCFNTTIIVHGVTLPAGMNFSLINYKGEVKGKNVAGFKVYFINCWGCHDSYVLQKSLHLLVGQKMKQRLKLTGTIR